MPEEYTDKERKLIAEKEYDESLTSGKDIYIDGHTEAIGTVREVVENETGLKAYVIENADGSGLSVLYQGSVAPPKAGSKVDWLENDLPMAKNILSGRKEVTPQLESAAATLNEILKNYPDMPVTVYGHSLGSMDAQYALANVSDIERIAGAYIYQGPNIYRTLTEEQQATVDAMKYRIHNYVDQKDSIAFGYIKNAPGYKAELTSQNAVGIIYHVDSKARIDIIEQHMWGGYQWNADGSLKIVADTSVFEARYSKAFDRAATGFYRYNKLKTQLSATGGGLSKHEEIFLDSELAAALSAALSEAAKQGEEAISSKAQEAAEEAETLYQSLSDVPFGFILSPDEVLQAYNDAGLTYSSIVTDVKEHFDTKTDAAKGLSDDFDELSSQIKTGIEQKLAEDQQLAGEFNQWMQEIN
ncbi:Mbeg1-like protein [Streptococcus sp. H31]|uniref:Mbeg1-like protein n=1 Tax=Streptococcus huangxiaojuni TaxID=3237239 RepID=UPI0034A3CBB3